jgi:autotransporter-associated beta strand protein
MVTLAFDNNYLGKWTVDSGILTVNTANGLSTGANVNIAAGATLDVSSQGALTYALSTTALSASGTGTGAGTAASFKADPAGIIDLATGSKGISLTFTPTAFLGDLTHPSLYISQGTLSLNGNAFSINNASGTALGVGTYRLILQASGSITSGSGYSVTGVTGSGLVAGNVASIVVTGSEVDLVVSPYVPKNLVWSGTGSTWDIATTSDWLNGVASIIFNNSDNVTFNGVGLANPSVTLAGTLAPSSVVVSNASAYTFSSGQIAGGASLYKTGPSSLTLNEANTYGGGTVVSNGTLKVGVNNAVSSTGAGDVKVVSPATLDLNGFNNTVNGLNGDGTMDVTSGGASTLTVGENGNNGAFTGTIKNTSGTMSVTKDGSGIETLSGANSYSGPTTINSGSLRASNANAIGSGASAVTVNVGATLDVGVNNVAVSTISGVGMIANNTTATTNTLIVNGTSVFNGTIADGSGGGGISVLVPVGANLRLGVANSYSGGSIVSAGAVLQIGNVGSMGSGGIIASNGAVVGMSNANNPSGGMGNTITTADNATILFTGGGNQANNANGQFIGGPTATNVLTNAFSIGAANSFASFQGTVIVGPSTSGRFFNALGGGDSTTFDFEGGNLFSRDANTIRLGALKGGSQSSSIGNVSFGVPATWIIGNKGLSTTFSGGIGVTNSIVKSGAGSLTLNGMVITTNTDNTSFTNYLYAPIPTYWGSTTVSNGTLAVIAPDSLTNSSSITLAGAGAVLDASKMGWASNYVDPVFSQNVSDIITNGTLNLAAVVPLTGGAQSLSGIGSITGQLLADTGTTVSPGLPTGTLTVSSNVTLNAVNMNVALDRSASPNCGQLAAAGTSTITVNGGTLTITNGGNDLVTGDVFHLFNKASIGNFAVTNLPASNALNTVSYVFTNKLAIDGTLVVLSGASAIANYSTNITATVSGNTLTVAWPSTHLGWELEIQTNSLSTGLAANWVTNYGTASVTSTNFTIDPSMGSVFYRLVHP